MAQLLDFLTDKDKREFELGHALALGDVEEGESVSLSLRQFPVMVDEVACQASCLFVVAGARKGAPMEVSVLVELSLDLGTGGFRSRAGCGPQPRRRVSSAPWIGTERGRPWAWRWRMRQKG